MNNENNKDVLNSNQGKILIIEKENSELKKELEIKNKEINELKKVKKPISRRQEAPVCLLATS